MKASFKLLFFIFLIISIKGYTQTEDRPKYMPLGNKHRNLKDENMRKQGVWKVYSRDGQLISETTYQNDVKHGPCMKYHSFTGILLEEMSYFNGVKDGDYKKYFPSGELNREGSYKDGKKFGKWTYYYKVNGEKKAEGEFKNNKKQGEWRYYSSQGKVIMSGSYKNNMKDGEWKYFDKEGAVIKTIFFVNDVEQNGKEDKSKTTKTAAKKK